MTRNEQKLFRETLEFIRKAAAHFPGFQNSDQASIDRWILSELSYTAGDIDEIYDGAHNVNTEGLQQGPRPLRLTYEELLPYVDCRLSCEERDGVYVVVAEVPGLPVLFTHGDAVELASGRLAGKRVWMERVKNESSDGIPVNLIGLYADGYDLIHMVSD